MLKPFNSMLLCADRSSEAQDALRKASILARYLGASIELFACDADHAWAVAQSPRSASARAALDSCLAASRTYVEALRGSTAATDLRISTSVACVRGMVEGVVERVDAARHDLVVKSFDTGPERDRWNTTSADLCLVQQSRVPLLLTRARPWSTPLRIWVALDLRRCDARLGRRVIGIARSLAQRCDGRCTVVHCEGGADAGSALRGVTEARRLFGLVDGSVAEVLEGPPLEVLSPTLRAAGADLLLIARGASVAGPARVKPLVERLLGEVGCDVLLIPDEAVTRPVSSGPVAPLTADAPHRQG